MGTCLGSASHCRRIFLKSWLHYEHKGETLEAPLDQVCPEASKFRNNYCKEVQFMLQMLLRVQIIPTLIPASATLRCPWRGEAHPWPHRACRAWSKPFHRRQTLRVESQVPSWLHFCTPFLQSIPTPSSPSLPGSWQTIPPPQTEMSQGLQTPLRQTPSPRCAIQPNDT